MDQKKEKRTLHGNSAKVSGEVFTCQSYRAPTSPDTFDMSTLPGSNDDLENARKDTAENSK